MIGIICYIIQVVFYVFCKCALIYCIANVITFYNLYLYLLVYKRRLTRIFINAIICNPVYILICGWYNIESR